MTSVCSFNKLLTNYQNSSNFSLWNLSVMFGILCNYRAKRILYFHSFEWLTMASSKEHDLGHTVFPKVCRYTYVHSGTRSTYTPIYTHTRVSVTIPICSLHHRTKSRSRESADRKRRVRLTKSRTHLKRPLYTYSWNPGKKTSSKRGYW